MVFGPWRRQFQHRLADIAADLGVEAALARMCPINAVVVDLPLVPVMAMTGALPGCAGIGADFAREQFDIADHRHACRLGVHDDFMRDADGSAARRG